ncbi:MAG: GTP 3',8-cyclase MoaA [Flavobacteriales bacterium]
MIDNHNRTVDYVRLAITDRCNLRCSYCMPENFSNFLAKDALLSFEELERMLGILHGLGIRKLRITGGEPFARKDAMTFIERIAARNWFDLYLTTNGAATAPYIERLKNAGIKAVNLSLDTLQADRFHRITKRNAFDEVMKTLNGFVAAEIPLKINTVVIDGVNSDELIDLVAFTKDHPVEWRFIEEMPFNGSGEGKAPVFTHRRILEDLQARYTLTPLPVSKNATAITYAIDGHLGQIGIIAAWSRTFCGTCNRLRISPKGDLKTCLYGPDVASVFELLRTGKSDEDIAHIFTSVVSKRHANGFDAEREMLASGQHRSMVTIGG